MSTRAHIRIFSDEGTQMLYHHHDGYPDGIGIDLKSIVDEIYDDPKQGIEKLINDKLELHDLGYEETGCLHGDEEYIYVIDCRDRTIKCFRRGLHDSFEDCFKAEKEVRIPEINET